MQADELLARALRDTSWVPADTTAVQRRGVAYLTCVRDVPMLNAVLHCGLPRRELRAFVGEVAEAHAGRHSRWFLGPTDNPCLAPILAAGGYSLSHRHHGYFLPADAAPPAPAGVVTRPVADMQGLRDASAVAGLAFGEEHPEDPDELARFLQDCTGDGARVHRVVAYDPATGAPLASGGMTLNPDMGIAMLWGGGTVPQGRGRGAYRAVLAARAAHAATHGIDLLGVYAREGTSAPILERLGFRRGAAMTLWDRPAR